MKQNSPVLVIHGGAGGLKLKGERRQLYIQSLIRVLAAAYPILLRGGRAVQAVTVAAAALEDDPLYNAGKGSKIQSDGKIRMSAALMDGHRRRFAGCVNVQGVKNPVRLALRLLAAEDRVLAGKGAQHFARQQGLAFASPFTNEQRAQFRTRTAGKSGTIGAVALDRQGRLAVATSTGGRGHEFPDRVSDSATVAGTFANPFCAVSATGIGEQIVEFAAAATICAYMEAGLSLRAAVRKLFKAAKKEKARFGVITLDSRGDFIAHTTTSSLIWAAATPSGLIFMPK